MNTFAIFLSVLVCCIAADYRVRRQVYTGIGNVPANQNMYYCNGPCNTPRPYRGGYSGGYGGNSGGGYGGNSGGGYGGNSGGGYGGNSGGGYGGNSGGGYGGNNGGYGGSAGGYGGNYVAIDPPYTGGGGYGR